MNREQYLLTKLAEECNEVAQMALKTQQFGFEESMPGQPYTNRERLIQELNDLYGILQMLNNEYRLMYIPDEQAVSDKMTKVNKYYGYSVDLGMVNNK